MSRRETRGWLDRLFQDVEPSEAAASESKEEQV